MADNYTLLGGGTNAYVPQLHQDIMVEFVMDPAKFKINKYINVRKVDKQLGYFIRMKNDGQNRYINKADVVWADGNDAPTVTYGNEAFEFAQFNCKRYAYTRRYGELLTRQAAWDVLSQGARDAAMQGMTARSNRVHTTITTSSNYLSANVFNASTAGGAVWGSATDSIPAIRKSVMTAAIAIQKQTLGTVQFKDLYLVMNPDTAQVVATSQEFIDFLKQNPTSIQLWQGDAQFLEYNIPSQLFGLNVVIDDTVINNSEPGPGIALSESYSFPDNVAVLLSKQQILKPSVGSGFSTFEIFSYQEFETFQYYDERNKRYDLQVVENVDDSFLLAPQSGALINTNS